MLGSETLRRYAGVLEDKRRMRNVETCRRLPALDQKLLLALKGRRGKEARIILPDAGSVAKWLQERLISVSTTDGQSVVLGLFYTNRDPFNRYMQKISVGIFPLYADITEYCIRPVIDLDFLQKNGKITLVDESAPGEDPFLVSNPNGPAFLFFKKSPFSEAEPYKTVLPDQSELHLPVPKLCEYALESNVIERALWYVANERKPKLFIQTGLGHFIKKNRFDQRYQELYAIFAKSRFRGRNYPEYNF